MWGYTGSIKSYIYLNFIQYNFLAIVAAAPNDKKVFGDECLDELKNEISGKKMAQDPHTLHRVSCVCHFSEFLKIIILLFA